jgi:polyhydroxyalkanoate synthesis regulator phasin
LKDTIKRFDKIENEMRKIAMEIKSIKPEEVKKVMSDIMAESRKSIEELRSMIPSMISPLDSQIKSLSEKIILLETRVTALEKLFREKTTVIIE